MTVSAPLLPVDQALRAVLDQVQPLAPVVLSCAESLGLVLAEDVVSDLDMPPYDKSLMDGYAVRAADCQAVPVELEVVEEIPAGTVPTRRLGPGQGARIMTGAPLPAGADAVVMVEDTEAKADGRVCVGRPIVAGTNIMPRGQELSHKQIVLAHGHRLRPQEIGVLATVGRAHVRVIPRPRVAVLSTGDEVVEAPARPGPGQIRNSNGPMALALAAQFGVQPSYLGIATDDESSLRAHLEQGLQHDVLVVTGGVSMGQRDLVPQVLDSLGVVRILHRVNIKPGKPIWCGRHQSTMVFGLPGNPVAVLVQMHVLVRPVLRKLMGHTSVTVPTIEAVLVDDKSLQSDRPVYYPARLDVGGSPRVRLIRWHGSPDLRATTEANALTLFPAGEHHFAAGDTVLVMPLEEWG